MSVSLVPYLNFPSGKTREAMTYYQDVFGGELSVNTFAEFGMEGMPPDGVMHAQLITDQFTVMASDAMPGAEATWGGTRVYLSLVGDDADTLQTWFARLAADGTVSMPLEKQIWGDQYGLVTDKFGLEWMVNIAAPQA